MYWSSVIMREQEDISRCNRFKYIIKEYIHCDIKKYTNMTINEYLNLTMYEKDMLVEMCIEFQKMEKDLAKDIELNSDMKIKNRTKGMSASEINDMLGIKG